MAPDADPTIARLRAAIADVDEALVAAVNRRLELVAEIRRAKEAGGMPFVQPDVEQRNLEALAGKNPGPLSADGLARLYRELLDLTKRELG
jgi:chorismate mutase